MKKLRLYEENLSKPNCAHGNHLPELIVTTIDISYKYIKLYYYIISKGKKVCDSCKNTHW